MGIFELKGEDSWEYNTIHDDRCCDTCDSFDGVVFTTSQIRRHFPYSFFGELICYPMTHPHCRCALAKITIVPEITVTIQVDKDFGKFVKPPKPVPMFKMPKLTTTDIAKIQKAITISVDRSKIPLSPTFDTLEGRVTVNVPNESFIIRAHKKKKQRA